MRDYSKVGPKFWIGATGKRLRAAGMEAQIVAMYLLTSPHANMLGLYYCPVMFIAHETGIGLEGASKGLQSAIEAGFCEYDEASEVVWVIEMASYQVGEALKPNDLRVKGVQNEYASLPENPYLVRFYEKYGAVFHMESCRGNESPFEAPLKPLRSQEQEQEQEQEQKKEKQGGAGAPGTPDSGSTADPADAGAGEPAAVPDDQAGSATPAGDGKAAGGEKLPRALGVRELVAEGVDRRHAEDWLKVRKEKRAPLTQTAWDDVKLEAEKAGITPAEAVRVSATNSWQGFKASWMEKAAKPAPAGARGQAHGGFAQRDYGQGGRL